MFNALITFNNEHRAHNMIDNSEHIIGGKRVSAHITVQDTISRASTISDSGQTSLNNRKRSDTLSDFIKRDDERGLCNYLKENNVSIDYVFNTMNR